MNRVLLPITVCLLYLLPVLAGCNPQVQATPVDQQRSKTAESPQEADSVEKQVPNDSETIDVLFIGNSYTAGIHGAINRLIQSENISANVEFICPGGVTLARHLANSKVTDKLKSQSWDIVVIQEQSQIPSIELARDQYLESAKGLTSLAQASGGQTLIFETWGRRDGDSRFSDDDTYAQMQSRLDHGFQQAEEQTQSDAAPIGRVWKALYTSDPELGRQLYHSDGSHPSATGAYLAALVFVHELFDTPILSIQENCGLKETDARKVREFTADFFEEPKQ